MTTIRSPDDRAFLNRVVEATIRIGLVLLLGFWCLKVLMPFVVPIIWGAIIAIGTFEMYRWLESKLGGRSKLAALIYATVGVLLLLGPIYVLGDTLYDGARLLAGHFDVESKTVPAPPDDVAEWPVIGAWLFELWSDASVNINEALAPYAPQLKEVAEKLLGIGAALGVSLLQFLIAIGLSAVFLVKRAEIGRAVFGLARRLGDERGEAMAELARTTTRSVVRGVVGVAVVQAALGGIGFLVAGIPGAGLWALLGLILCVVQIGMLPIMIPVIGYAFYSMDTVPAVLLTIWCAFVGLIDNILRPVFMARGIDVPMTVIFVGSIGGLMANGIIGLFLGPVVLALGYKLMHAWLADGTDASGDNQAPR